MYLYKLIHTEWRLLKLFEKNEDIIYVHTHFARNIMRPRSKGSFEGKIQGVIGKYLIKISFVDFKLTRKHEQPSRKMKKIFLHSTVLRSDQTERDHFSFQVSAFL